MSYLATVVVRGAGGWMAHDVDLDDVIRAAADRSASLDDLVEIVTTSAGDADAVMFVDEDDEYLAIVRISDPDADPRIFLSDGRAAQHYDVPAVLLSGLGAGATQPVTDDDDAPAAPGPGPVGDTDLLADLGTPARRLLSLCEAEGLLPGDIVAEIAESGGFAGELEAVRSA